MITLIKIELEKIFRRKRSYIGFASVFGIILIVQLAMYVEGDSLLNFFIQNLKDIFLFEGNLLNGYFITFMLLNSMWVLMPFLVTLIAGDMIAGEAHNGTLRIILSRPVSRKNLIIAKIIAVLVYVFLLVLFMMICSLLLGQLLFGSGDLIVYHQSLNIFEESDIMWRFMMAFTYGFLGMMVVASLAFLLSVFTDNSLSPIIITMALVIGFTIISNLNLDIFNYIRPFVFTTYISSWSLFFDYAVDWQRAIESAVISVLHIAVFCGIAICYFNKKDILS
ncbi:MAG: ABC transporter permease [Bacteroidales bacterium]|nr:ABC transporter permease [Bacteroidales bacterium]